ncbi:hypothetical protein [Planococcus shenhongbingii]|uniref:DUF1640 domain-containing protein n=1 Tax=Planococcus shenhongbingii TaxID=3058398 RepID=A0ABT8N7X0_9BACL|nr:hypothetical protein [Planococcus sp. N017]MDN7243966.1 hypothetical protein [Planococcus sp. N017]
MEETSTTTSAKGIKVKGGVSNSNKETPPELLKIIKDNQYLRVDGFIHGNASARIIKNDTQTDGKINEENVSRLTLQKNVTDKGNDLIMENRNSMDTLFNELKTDMREREVRSRQEISEREKRFENQLESFAKTAEAREERFMADNQEREARINDLIKTLDTKITGLDTKMDNHKNHIETMKNQNWWGNVGMFGALVAILIALIIALVTIIR